MISISLMSSNIVVNIITKNVTDFTVYNLKTNSSYDYCVHSNLCLILQNFVFGVFKDVKQKVHTGKYKILFIFFLNVCLLITPIFLHKST